MAKTKKKTYEFKESRRVLDCLSNYGFPTLYYKDEELLNLVKGRDIDEYGRISAFRKFAGDAIFPYLFMARWNETDASPKFDENHFLVSKVILTSLCLTLKMLYLSAIPNCNRSCAMEVTFSIFHFAYSSVH